VVLIDGFGRMVLPLIGYRFDHLETKVFRKRNREVIVPAIL